LRLAAALWRVGRNLRDALIGLREQSRATRSRACRIRVACHRDSFRHRRDASVA